MTVILINNVICSLDGLRSARLTHSCVCLAYASGDQIDLEFKTPEAAANAYRQLKAHFMKNLFMADLDGAPAGTR